MKNQGINLPSSSELLRPPFALNSKASGSKNGGRAKKFPDKGTANREARSDRTFLQGQSDCNRGKASRRKGKEEDRARRRSSEVNKRIFITVASHVKSATSFTTIATCNEWKEKIPGEGGGGAGRD